MLIDRAWIHPAVAVIHTKLADCYAQAIVTSELLAQSSAESLSQA